MLTEILKTNQVILKHPPGSCRWVDEAGVSADIVESPDMFPCVICGKKFTVGDVRYRVGLSGSFNWCRSCVLARREKLNAHKN